MSEQLSLDEQRRRDAQTMNEATIPPLSNTTLEHSGPQRPGSVDPTMAGDAVLPGQIHTREQFAACLSQSGLMTADELKSIDDSLPPDERPVDAAGLADLLIRRKKLTDFQVNLLRLGQTKGLVFGNYAVVDKLGEGGMGVVFKAHHRRMKRTVALKVLPADLTNSADALARFHREVEAAAKLTHPNIAAAYDADEANGVHFLVMEHVDGLNLSQTVKANGPLPLGQALNLVLQSARGLNHAHLRGVVHRDIKPGNLLLDKTGVVKVLDMGLARFDATGDDGNMPQAELTQSGRVMGTVDYMAPEQALDAKHADHRADIYSLGCTFYYLLTGHSISPDGTLTQKLIWHQTESVPPLSQICPAVGPKLDEVFRKMLAKKPADRQQSMGEVIGDLEACAGELSPEDAAAALSGGTCGDMADATLNQIRKSHATVVERRTATDHGTLPSPALATAPAGTPPKGKLPLLVGGLGGLAAIIVAAVFAANKFKGDGDKVSPDSVVPVSVVGEETQVHLEITQPGTSVFLDGQEIQLAIGKTDMDEQHRCLPVKSGKKYRIKVSKSGFEDFVQDVSPLGKQHEQLKVALRAVAGPIAPPVLPKKTELLRWVIANRGSATLLVGSANKELEIHGAKDIPSDSFTIKAITLDDAKSLAENDLAKQLSAAEGLQTLSLKGAVIGDQAASELAKVKSLWSLNLSQTKITDLGLEKLAGLPELRDLDLQKTNVGDEGLKGIDERLPKLEKLFLTDTQVTDGGLLNLAKLNELQTVSLNGTKVSIPGVDALKNALPKLKVAWDPPDVEREIARKLLSTGATISLLSLDDKPLGEIRKAADLPVERFQIRTLDWSGKVQITDADLSQLTQLPKLQSLTLDGTGVTADGVAKLASLKSLKVIDLGSLQLPDPVVDGLKAVFPGGEIRWAPNNERLVAQWILEQKGTVGVATPDGEILSAIDDVARLPAGRFSLTYVKLDGNETLTDADLKKFKGFARLETLLVSNTAVGDTGLAELANCAALRDIGLNGTKVTDTGMAIIGRFSSLRMLLLSGTDITDHGLEQLNNVRQLTDLSLAKTKVTDDGLLQLTRFTGLNRLSLAETVLTDAALPQLSKFASLSQLFVSGTKITDAGVEELSVALPKCKVQGNPPHPQRLALRWILSQGGTAATKTGEVRKPSELPRGPCELTKIYLTDLNKVTGEMLANIALCTNLDELDLSGTSTNDEGLKHVAKMTSLTQLSLANTRVSDVGLVQLKNLTKIKSLDLQGTRVKGLEFANLSGLTALDTLNLDSTQISDRGAAQLAQFTTLVALNLNNNPSITDKGVGQLAPLVKLQSLGLRGTLVGDPAMAPIAKFADLQQLDLSSSTVTDAGVAQLRSLANLRTLNLSGTTVGDGSLGTAAGFKNLRSLDVAKTKVTDGGVATLQKSLPDCRISKSEKRADPDRPPLDGPDGGGPGRPFGGSR